MGSYSRSGHFRIRLDWDRPHERTEPWQGRNKCTRRGDVKQLLPSFSSCPLASTAACPQAAKPLFTLLTEGVQLLACSHPKRSQTSSVLSFHGLFWTHKHQKKKMKTIIRAYSGHMNLINKIKPYVIFILLFTLSAPKSAEWLIQVKWSNLPYFMTIDHTENKNDV